MIEITNIPWNLEYEVISTMFLTTKTSSYYLTKKLQNLFHEGIIVFLVFLWVIHAFKYKKFILHIYAKFVAEALLFRPSRSIGKVLYLSIACELPTCHSRWFKGWWQHWDSRNVCSKLNTHKKSKPSPLQEQILLVSK